MEISTFLVFGASGPVGRFLLPRLTAAGARVHAVSRAPQATAVDAVRWIAGDLFAGDFTVPGDVAGVISLGPLDAFARWFAHGAPVGTRRVVALSSMSAESKRASTDPGERDLAARLRDAETGLAHAAQARGVAWTILRPTLIYGNGRDRSLAPIARFAWRWRVLPVPIGASGLRQPVHADDLAGAVLAAIDMLATDGRIYPVGGGERLRFDEMLGRIRAATPRFILRLPVPPFMLRLALRSQRTPGVAGSAAIARLREPLVADNTAAARDFGYAPREFAAGDVLPED